VTDVQTIDAAHALALNVAPWAMADLPPFPAVAIQLLQLLSEDDADVAEVSKFIAAEPVFAADVLHIANSALYGRRSGVRTVSKAVWVLGLERVKGISLSRAFGMYVMPALGVDALQRCWRHSLAGAIAAEKLAAACRIDPDVAYTAGLLRDIGRLALLVKYPDPYANLLAVFQEKGYDLVNMERDLFDIDHCQAGGWLMTQMPLPGELRQVVTEHHNQPSGKPFGLVQLVRVADLISDALGFGTQVSPPPEGFADALAELPEAAWDCSQHDPEALAQEIESKIQIFCPA
jgi:putative nucleotidyltransferase with HDIG domain